MINMDSAKVLFLIAAAAILDPSANAASVNQNWGGSFNAQQPGKPSYEGTNTPQVSSDRLNIFDTELLRHAARQNSGNFMISPASVKAALAMLLEGAKGSCADELKRILKLPNDQEQVRQHFNAFLASLNTRSEGVLLESANKIFLSDNYTPNNKYVQILKSNYYSDLLPVNFSHPQTPVHINRIINASTHGLIPDVLGPGDVAPDTIMILTNVLYFRGLWENAFNTKNTQPKCFNVDSACRNVAMMETRGDYKYGFIDELQSQAVEIPYKGGKYSMMILLPNDVNGLSTLITELPYFPLPKILDQLDETEVELSMPRFTINYSQDLISILQQVGIQEVFNSNADLFGIVARGVKSPQVNSVFHKTHITVNEQGSIAAAVTGAMVVPLMGTTTARMNIDHPFLFFIRDVKTGTVLFQGRVTHPNEVYVPPPKPTVNPTYQDSFGFPQNQPTNTGRQPAPLSANSNINFQQPSNVQQVQREKEVVRPQRPQPERIQPTYSNERVQPTYSNERVQPTYTNERVQPTYTNERVQPTYTNERVQPTYTNERTEQEYNRGQSSQAEQNYYNVGQQRVQPQSLPPNRVLVISGINYQQIPAGKQQSSGSNTPITYPLSSSNLNPKTQHDSSRNPSVPNQSHSVQPPVVSEHKPSVNVNSYYEPPTHDGSRVRDNKVSNNVFGLQRRPQDSVDQLNSYAIQAPPSRMDVVYQTTLSKDRDAITFTM